MMEGEGGVLLMKCSAVLVEYRALLVECRAVFVEYRALLMECRAVFVDWRAEGVDSNGCRAYE